MLFESFRENIEISELTELPVSYLMLGVGEKLSSKKHIRRNLQAEFCNVLLFKNLIATIIVFISPANLIPFQVAKYTTTLLPEKQF